MNLPENIYLVRHGEYSDETQGLIELGREQAARAGEKLAAEGFDESSSLLASSALRCVETAEIIAQVLNLKSEIVYDRRLFEMEEYALHLETPPQNIIGEMVEKAEMTAEKDTKMAVIAHGGVIFRMMPELEIESLVNGCVHKFCPSDRPLLD